MEKTPYQKAADQLNVPLSGVWLVQVIISWHEFVATPVAENANVLACRLEAYMSALASEKPEAKRRARKVPELAAGYGAPGTTDEQVAKAQRRRGAPAEQSAGEQQAAQPQEQSAEKQTRRRRPAVAGVGQIEGIENRISINVQDDRTAV